MKLRSTLFTVTAAAVMLSIFILLSADCRNSAAQTNSDKSPASKQQDTKAANKIAEESSGLKVTFVEIGSVKCIPCKMMQPIMKAVEEEYKGQVKIVFHDVWTAKGKYDAMIYNFRVIPTQIFLDGKGKEYFRHEGFFPKDEVVKVIKMKGVK